MWPPIEEAIAQKKVLIAKRLQKFRETRGVTPCKRWAMKFLYGCCPSHSACGDVLGFWGIRWDPDATTALIVNCGCYDLLMNTYKPFQHLDEEILDLDLYIQKQANLDYLRQRAKRLINPNGELVLPRI